MASPGETLGGRYLLIQPIGAGGMATVWRARDTRLRRQVAVKLLRPELAQDDDLAGRFESEARHAASLSHPNVATVYDTDTDADTGERYIVMELVDGPTVADVLAQRGVIEPDLAVEITAAAARALAAAHRRGLIHRDVKPANLLIGRDGRVRLADFGIARALTAGRVTMPGTVLGSIPYLSPEQARGDDASAAGDIFSLGVVLYEMLTGRLPWEADTPGAMATMRLNVPAPAPSTVATRLPRGLDSIVAKALALDPAERYPSARVFADALESWRRRQRRALRAEVQRGGEVGAAHARPATAAALRSSIAAVAAEAAAGVAADVASDSAIPASAGAQRARTAAGIARGNPWANPPLGRGLTRRRAVAPRSEPSERRAERERPAAAPPSPAEGSHPRRQRRAPTRALSVPALLLLFGFAGALLLQPDGRSAPPDAGPGAALSTAAVVVIPTVPATPRVTVAPLPTPLPTPPPTRKPTPRPTPIPTQRLTAGTPADAVVRFYSLVVAHDWQAAIDMWSLAMQQRYPPESYLIDRFRKTTRIDITRLHTVFVDSEGGRARVEVTLVEYRTVEPSPRTFVGAWDLVRIDGRWLLNDPDF